MTRDESLSAEAVKHRVLIVEDDTADRVALRRALRRVDLDLEVIEAATVAEARSALEENGLRWVLSDYLLPDGEGRDVLNLARERVPQAAVIILTGKGDETLAAQLMREGARDYIPKDTLSPDRLASSLRASASLVEAERIAAAVAAGQRFLAEAGAALVGTLELSEIARTATRLAVDTYADLCMLDSRARDGTLERLDVAGRAQVAPSEVVEALADASPVVDLLESEEIAGGLSLSDDDERLSDVVGGEMAAAALRAAGPIRMLTLPLRSGTDPSGLITFARLGSRGFDELELPTLRRYAERVALALDNARLYRQLQRALAARDDVLAVVAHDLRNPLTAIVGSTSILQSLELSAEARSRQLKLIETAARRMTSLVEDLLDVAKLEEGALSIEPVALDPRALLQETTEMLSTKAEDADVTLVVDIDDDCPRVQVDPTRGAQVLENLTDNAIRFSPRGGRVTLGARADGEFVRFHVADEGPGVQPEELPRLFERFWQSTTGPRRGRAGLGLTIARGLVRLHGGDIGASSEPGRGTEFWFTLPRSASDS